LATSRRKGEKFRLREWGEETPKRGEEVKKEIESPQEKGDLRKRRRLTIGTTAERKGKTVLDLNRIDKVWAINALKKKGKVKKDHASARRTKQGLLR